MVTVLVHGAWSTGEIWRQVRNELGGEVLTPTLPGCGPGGEVGTTLEDCVAGLLEVLAALKRVTLVGHSWSALVTWMAAARSTSVRRLLLVEPFEPVQGEALIDAFGDEQRESELAAIAEHDGWWPPPTAEELAQDDTLAPATASRLLDMLYPHPGLTVTDEVSGPLQLSDVEVVQLSSPQGDLATGHWPMVTAPAALSAWIHRQANRD